MADCDVTFTGAVALLVAIATDDGDCVVGETNDVTSFCAVEQTTALTTVLVGGVLDDVVCS